MNERQIKIIDATLYTGVKQAAPNNLIKNKILNPNPISKEDSIASWNFMSIILIRIMSVPDMAIDIILINSKEIRKVINKM